MAIIKNDMKSLRNNAELIIKEAIQKVLPDDPPISHLDIYSSKTNTLYMSMYTCACMFIAVLFICKVETIHMSTS